MGIATRIAARIYRHPIDVVPTVLTSTAVTIGLVAVVGDFGAGLFWALGALSVTGRLAAPSAQHNHSHLPAFRPRLLNAIYDVVLATGTGHAAAVWHLQHGLGHHREFLDPYTDPAGNFRFAFTRRWPVLARRAAFTVLADAMTIPDAWRIAARYPRKRRGLRIRLAIDVGVQAAVLATLLAAFPMGALAVFVIPNVLLRWFVAWFSFSQHHDAPSTNVYDGAITHFGIMNGILFNVGHHTAHHEKPTLHWSLLPSRTVKILHRIPPICLRGLPTAHTPFTPLGSELP